MAHQYVLADRMFQSNIDGSFVAHQYAIAAYADRTVQLPTGLSWGCPGGPSDTILTLNNDRSYGPSVPACFDNQTLGDELDAAGLSWRYYASKLNTQGDVWSAYQAINHIYNGPDWGADVVSPQSQFLNDIGNGQLAAVTWITPTFADSDHGGDGSKTGPSWVTSLVNAVGSSPFWSSSAIFIIWDDWGGWYDPVPPMYVDYDGFGFRIPMVIVSPYARQGYVSHALYETASIPRFIEDTFGLARLAPADRRAVDPAGDSFNFTQAPRTFHTFSAPYSPAFLRSRPVDHRLPDTD
jgi:phospholipase C